MSTTLQGRRRNHDHRTSLTVVLVALLALPIACGGSNETTPARSVAAPPPRRTPSAAETPDLPPSPHRENAKLVPEIVTALRDGGWSNGEVVGARVSSPTWQPIRNSLTGRLIAKAFEADVVVRELKEKDPEACHKYLLIFARDSAGGALSWLAQDGAGNAWSSRDFEPFPCSKAPK